MQSEAIGLNDVHRKFGRVRALDGVTLSVRTGEVYGFLGRNGAGKTTTLRVLTGIVRPDAGEITLLGKRVKKVDIELKRRIGYVSQEQVFYPWMTAAELGNFVGALYPSWDADEYKRLLKLLDVAENRRSVELSGGTRTKLGLALALAPRPPLLLLDEPTSGLDPVARTEFNELLQQMVRERGITAFMSSHLVDEVQDIADRVGIIQAGRMSFEGEVPVLRARVKRVRSAEPLTPSPGFARVYRDIWQADPGLWAAEPWPADTTIDELSLDDIFVAFARSTGERDA